MERLGIPGLIYNTHTSAAEMIFGKTLIRVFTDKDDNSLNVTADRLDGVGDFSKNMGWESFTLPQIQDTYEGHIAVEEPLSVAYTCARNAVRKMLLIENHGLYGD